MCGIYGSTRIYSNEIVQNKLRRMAFRGPDYSSFVNLEDKIILGHNRLAIIDLDCRSNQPFSYQHLVIVFNGEIYNYKTIKNDLIQKGYRFNTTSDTEVLCAAYLAYGYKCLDHFNGMFAFVLYDKANDILFGARDRVGKKPFYYTLKDNYFEFASQLSVISEANSFEVSDTSINKYLLRGYIEEPYSIYKEIYKLKAGHAFTYNLKNKNFYEFKYWDIDLTNKTSTLNYEEAKSSLRHLLEDAVKIRMISDVPIGTFLSGGIDSSLITAIAQSQSTNQVNSFSIKFLDKEFDESKHACAVAKHLGVNHTIIPCNYEDGIKIIEEINYFFDEPFADSAAVPTMLLARHTKKYMTVALTGDGGDEIFLGYNRVRWISKVRSFYLLPYNLRKMAAHILDLSSNYRNKVIAQHLSKDNINNLIEDSLSTFYPAIMSTIPEKSHGYEYILNCPQSNLQQKIADLDLKLWLCNDGLVKLDRATMAASMEARCPLLDYRVIEFGRSLPIRYRYKQDVQKRILKDILYEYVPKELVDRPKSGFTTPFREWFRTTLKDYMYDTLSRQNLEMIPNLNIEYVRNKINQHVKGEINFYPEIWRLIILVNWLRASDRNIQY